MLTFKDLNHNRHFINLRTLNNTVVVERNGQTTISFHMIGPHVVPVQVDKVTAERILGVLGEYR